MIVLLIQLWIERPDRMYFLAVKGHAGAGILLLFVVDLAI